MSVLFTWRRVLVFGGVALIISILIHKTFLAPWPLSPVVTTKVGDVQGNLRTSRDGSPFYEYLGIPYATPPLGKLRYEAPLPFTKSWTGIRPATQVGSSCLQIESVFTMEMGSEDCLFLNIFTPNLSGFLPVLVWLHGGLFSMGSGEDYPGDYFMDHDTVLITLNFRLNSFGFLSTGNEPGLSGNYGLKDQTLALTWIQDNIASFGGDPGRVTLVGESSGGVSAHLHTLSKTGRGLFHGVIAQSGIATLPWVLNTRPEEQFKRFSTAAGCGTSGNTAQVIDCLREKSASELVALHSEVFHPLKSSLAVFSPTLEYGGASPFLTKAPKDIIQSGEFTRVPLLAGVNELEGLVIAAGAKTNATAFSRLASNFVENCPLFLPGMEAQNLDVTTSSKIRDFYNLTNLDPESSPTPQNILDLTSLASDWMWFAGFETGIRRHLAASKSQKTRTYLYYYAYKSQTSFADIFLMYERKHPVWELLSWYFSSWWRISMLGKEYGVEERLGACHVDDVIPLFPMFLIQTTPAGSRDYAFSKELVRSWVAFASGVEKKLKFFGNEWTPVQQNKEPLRYMRLDHKEKSGMIESPLQRAAGFWRDLKKMF